LYALNKATALNALSINSATSAQAASQYFDCPQDITISGTDFYAYKLDAVGGISIDVTVSLFLAGPDSLPSGPALASTTVSVDTAFGGGLLTALNKRATWTPVTVSQPYLITVENISPNGIGLLCNDYTAVPGDGAGEFLSSVDLFGTWTRSYDVVVGTDVFDADWLFEPHVQYTIEADFAKTGGCVGATGGDGVWTNGSSPIFSNRMYSLATFLDLPEFQYTWNYGDGSPEENQIDGDHTYTGSSPWTVTLVDSLFGWTTLCIDVATSAASVEAGTLVANASPVCLDQGTADISATEGDAPSVPNGYSVLYVLTDADNNLTVVDAAATPDFTVTSSGNYIIHTLVYDPNTLDPATAIGLEAGVVNGLLVQGGGAICAALDLVGALITVEAPEAGTLTADASPICVGGIMSATEGDAPVVPTGYEVLYVLTDADNNLTVLDAAATPSFTSTTSGNFIIHTLVYDPNTLDPATAIGLEAGVVNGLLVQGGGSICAALDLAGAQITVEGPESGTLVADVDPVCFDQGSADISATTGDAPVVPTGYQVLYVLTDADNNLTVLDAAATPDFTVTSTGNYIIHTLVYDPNTLDPATAIGLEAGVVNGLLVQGGGTICAALDLAGAPIQVAAPEAGTLIADATPVCIGGSISATEGVAPVVPPGYSVLYVLTDAVNNLTVLDAAATPSFDATVAGNFIIHTLVYDPATLDPTIAIGLEALVVNSLLAQGGGTICAALDLVGASVEVEDCTPINDLCVNATPINCGDVVTGSTESATDTDASACDPDGLGVWYSIVGDGSIISLDLSGSDYDTYLSVTESCGGPCFEDDDDGGAGLTSALSFVSVDQQTYYIQISGFGTNTGNYQLSVECTPPPPNDLCDDAIDIQCGETIAGNFALQGLVTADNTDVTCASDGFTPGVGAGLWYRFVGTGEEVSASTCGSNADTEIVVYSGDCNNQVCVGNNDDDCGLQSTVNFFGVAGTEYFINVAYWTPNTFPTTGDFELSVTCVCTADAGTITADATPVCLDQGSADISATHDGNSVIPTGYVQAYVLTQASDLLILDLNTTPDFTVSAGGDYIIHTVIYDPLQVDPTQLPPGTTGFDVNALLQQGGGTMCGSLDVTGALITVEAPEAGTLVANNSTVGICAGGTADISATEGDAPVVPTGYEVLYVLTDADNNLTVIDAAATPDFTVNSTGNYIIHTLVYDPNTLDPATAIGLEALVVNGLLVQGGGSICAALDLTGAPVEVIEPEAGTLTAVESDICTGGNIAAITADAPVVPDNYSVLYVLTDAGNNLTIVDASASPSFVGSIPGDFIIHTLVYDPNTLDPATLIGVEALVANSLLVQGGGTICAALDLTGAAVSVEGPTAGTLTADVSPVCLDQGSADISATEGDAPIVPTGYEVLYVLTDADNNLTVIDAAATPQFTVTAGGNYIIHTLVYDPNTLDPATAIGLEALVVNGLLVQGGGSICAALDLVGAPVTVEAPESGTLTADASLVCIGGSMSATEGDAPVVPAGYSVLYVLTDADNNLTVIDAAATPSFPATTAGNFIIHTLVYDSNTLDPTTAIGLEAGVVNGLLVQGGGSICAALDLVGAPITVEGPEAGTLVADVSPLCLDQGSADISATTGDAPVVPTGYEVLYVLTDADNNLTVIDAAATPQFTVTAGGNYIIHTLVYDPNTLDPTTAIGLEALVVNGLLVQGGGSICAALDLVGALVTVNAPEAGTLIADASSVCLNQGTATISATEGDAPVVPTGYSVLYVLTDADNNLTVIDAAGTPSFTVTSGGNYIIHTLVYDPNTLDPTTAVGLEALVVNGLLVQGGGSICAALDLVGAPISVVGPEAGTLVADVSPVCLDQGSADISATTGDAPVVPAGYEVLYVLTDADNNLTVIDAATSPQFTVTAGGNYIIHTLVYDPNTLDPTTAIGLEALVVNGLLVQGGGSICAALDLVGAPITVDAPSAGTLTADVTPLCLDQGSATISATQGDAPNVPAGYSVLYVLTDADNNLTVIDAAATPEFTVTAEGNYIIHTLVYDPNTLDPATAIDLEAGVVNGLLVQGGGSICAALDLVGAPILVEECPCDAEAGTLLAVSPSVCVGGTISATVADAPVVPAGYEVLYVLTDADNNLTVIDAASTPSFAATTGGNFIIHTLVYDPNTLDPTTAIGLEALVVNSLLIQGGGSICAALDLVGAPVSVVGPVAGTLSADATPVCMVGGSADISATVGTASEVPTGYAVFYVLTDADNNLLILNGSPTPAFTVTAPGNYIIHTLVYDPLTLNPATAIGLEAGVVNGLLVQGGGSICAALDLVGAPIFVEGPTAGSLVAGNSPICIGEDITATEGLAPVVPTGYEVLYVLTDADNNLTVLDAAATPSFTATAAGNYIIHTLVYDPNTLDPTTAIGLEALVVNGLLVQGGGSICAALDLTGATVTVNPCNVGIDELTDGSVAVYPNPSNGEFVIELTGVDAEEAQILIFDMAGRQVFSESAAVRGDFRKTMNLNVAKGSYLLQIITENDAVSRKLQIN
jgi:hypothetical protein